MTSCGARLGCTEQHWIDQRGGLSQKWIGGFDLGERRCGEGDVDVVDAEEHGSVWRGFVDLDCGSGSS